MLRTRLLVLLALACTALALLALPTGLGAHPGDNAVDQDHDAVTDPPLGNDNCAGGDGAYNPRQEDLDRDGRGDACDIDDDGDTVDDAVDNCPLAFNQGQSDLDGDAIGDLCDSDDDGDGLTDSRDNCRFVHNPGQADADRDGLGDACDQTTPGAPRPPPPPDPTAPPGPPDAPGAPDTSPPVADVAMPSRHRAAELGAGLAVPVSCSEGCTVSSTLTVSARDARRLKLRGRVLGTGGAELAGAGETFAFIDLPRSALRRIRGRGVRAVLRVEVADAAGNRDVVTRRLTLRS
ncbi:MAG TPA: thrombospondin type 3 repeat-containing protein [Solirubrobacteraceae bacterium]|nr:thrombospondin type 3 repeat-containing protein [Solirubrobacteraceae bacterium]